MKVSFFETGRYCRRRPTCRANGRCRPAAYDPEIGVKAYAAIIERLKFVEELGFDWVSVSEHHYSPRILTPSPVVSAAFMAAHATKIKIALLGPIVPTSNPIRVAEELAMLDTMAPGKIVVGLLRGTTNEYLSYDLNPKEARERTDEGMELILKAWTEPQPFGWQGRYFQYRTISLWPRPHHRLADLFARHQRRNRRVRGAPPCRARRLSYGNLELDGARRRPITASNARPTAGSRGATSIIYRANMILGETDEAADLALERRSKQAPFPLARRPARCADRLGQAQHRRREAGRADVGGVLPITFCGGPDRIVEQIKQWREEIGVGVVDLSLQDPGTGDTRRDDGRARPVRAQGAAAHPRDLTKYGWI